MTHALRSRRVAAWILACVAAATALAYHRVLLLGETFVLKDWLIWALPARQFLAEALRSGRLPEWCDLSGVGGFPFLANPDHWTLYAPVWPVALLSPIHGADLVMLAHILFGGVGAAFLARRLGAEGLGAGVAGALFVSTGYVSSSVVNGLTPMVCWTPWVAWAADRLAASIGGSDRARATVRDGAVFAVTFSPLLLLGEPGSLLSAALLAAVVIVVRSERPVRAVVGLAAAGIAAIPLAAASILPALYALQASSRATGLPVGVAGEWSLHPVRLLELVWPGALGGPSFLTNLARVVADAKHLDGALGYPGWSTTAFLGAPALMLAVLPAGRRRDCRWLLVASIAFVVLALGVYTPAWAAVRAVFPPERMMRYPEKHVVGAIVLWTALAGVGVTEVVRRRVGARVLAACTAVALALAAGVGLVGLSRASLEQRLLEASRTFEFPLRASPALDRVLGGGAVAVLSVVVFGIGLALARAGRARAGAALVVAAALVPPMANVSLADWTVPRDALSAPPHLLARVHPRPGVPRPRLLVSVGHYTDGDLATPDRYAAWMHENAVLRSASRFGFQVVNEQDSYTTRAEDILVSSEWVTARYASAAGLVGADLVLIPDWDAPKTGYAPIAWNPVMHTALLAPAPVRPHAFVTPRWHWAAGDDALGELLAPGREQDLAEVALVAPGPTHPPDQRGVGPLSPCAVDEERPEVVHVRCSSPAGGYAVLLDAASSGWSATVDGAPAAIEVADGLFRAVAVGPGPHEVVFRYATPGLAAGVVISIAGWGAILAALWLARRPAAPAPTEGHTPAGGAEEP